jgi:hypothetical protein
MPVIFEVDVGVEIDVGIPVRSTDEPSAEARTNADRPFVDVSWVVLLRIEVQGTIVMLRSKKVKKFQPSATVGVCLLEVDVLREL